LLEQHLKTNYGDAMTLEIKLNLPDNLAKEAKAKGLLEAPAIENLLRDELKRRRVDKLFADADRLASVKLPPMSEAELEAEIRSARTTARK